ncbi:MAG: hypothetical protein HKO92_06395 [Flavobacteriaceae bacterium]|nr:hypothetical protein [Bacteroidia bacterium]NNK82733.1 hypothetical protein [Flavobacteriaceae bacterium]
MKLLKLTSILFFCYSLSIAQNVQFADGNETYFRENYFISLDSDTSYDVEGSKYLMDSFLPAVVSTMPDKLFNIKYNIFSGEMEVQSKNDKVYALNKYRKDISITFINSKITFQLFDYLDSENSMKLGYFQVINRGDNKVLKKHKIIFMEEKPSKTGYDEHRPPQYKRLDDKYYLNLESNPNAVELPKNKNKFAALFPDNKSDILDFIKSNKIKLSKENDLKKLINYINTL